MYDYGRTHTGFVGKNAALKAPGDCLFDKSAADTAGHGFERKSMAEDSSKSRKNLFSVHAYDNNCSYNVEACHKGHKCFVSFGNAIQAAQSYEGSNDCHTNTDQESIYACISCERGNTQDTFPNRSELKRFITEKGGKLAGSMSAKVDYLIMNNDAYDSEKKKKAEELGIDIITEQLLNEKAERHFYINNKGVLVSYLGPGGDVVIPEGVTEIGHRAFWGRSTLKTVAIPDSVTEIGSCAFWECKSLISVSVPEGVTKISDYTFCSCNALASVFLPESIKSIHKTAFNGCNSSFKIHAPVGSYAEAYAKKNKIPFVAE